MLRIVHPDGIEDVRIVLYIIGKIDNDIALRLRIRHDDRAGVFTDIRNDGVQILRIYAHAGGNALLQFTLRIDRDLQIDRNTGVFIELFFDRLFNHVVLRAVRLSGRTFTVYGDDIFAARAASAAAGAEPEQHQCSQNNY